MGNFKYYFTFSLGFIFNFQAFHYNPISLGPTPISLCPKLVSQLSQSGTVQFTAEYTLFNDLPCRYVAEDQGYFSLVYHCISRIQNILNIQLACANAIQCLSNFCMKKMQAMNIFICPKLVMVHTKKSYSLTLGKTGFYPFYSSLLNTHSGWVCALLQWDFLKWFKIHNRNCIISDDWFPHNQKIFYSSYQLIFFQCLLLIKMVPGTILHTTQFISFYPGTVPYRQRSS